MALFKKPNHLKYTELCMYIDENVYRDDLTTEEENTIFEYLYHIANMLARKGGYFSRSEYYEDFAAYFASSVYFRLRNPKQYIIDPKTNEPKLSKIKSVLNYMKNVAYLRKMEFEQEFYSQALSPALNESDDVEYALNYTFSDKLSESIEDITAVDFELCLNDICLTTKNFLKKIPYKTNPVVWNNIYLSCLLTLINNLTLSNKTIARIDNLKYDIRNRPRAVDNLFKDSPENYVILYHLDKSMRDYIWILTQEVKHLIAKDLSLSLHNYIPVSTSLNTIALADINLEEYSDYGD